MPEGQTRAGLSFDRPVSKTTVPHGGLCAQTERQTETAVTRLTPPPATRPEPTQQQQTRTFSARGTQCKHAAQQDQDLWRRSCAARPLPTPELAWPHGHVAELAQRTQRICLAVCSPTEESQKDPLCHLRAACCALRTENVFVCCCCAGSDRAAGVRGMQALGLVRDDGRPFLGRCSHTTITRLRLSDRPLEFSAPARSCTVRAAVRRRAPGFFSGARLRAPMGAILDAHFAQTAGSRSPELSSGDCYCYCYCYVIVIIVIWVSVTATPGHAHPPKVPFRGRTQTVHIEDRCVRTLSQRMGLDSS